MQTKNSAQIIQENLELYPERKRKWRLWSYLVKQNPKDFRIYRDKRAAQMFGGPQDTVLFILQERGKSTTFVTWHYKDHLAWPEDKSRPKALNKI